MPIWMNIMLQVILILAGCLSHASHAESIGEPPWTKIGNSDGGVRFESDRLQYVEGLVDGRWVGRNWNSGGRTNWPFEVWEKNAFVLEIDGNSCATDWQWVGGEELPQTERGARHHVATLQRTDPNIELQIHTLVDGTPILVRWLEIVNRSDRPFAITKIAPWSTRVWANPGQKYPNKETVEAPFRVGRFTRDDWASEGWFQWQRLKVGETLENVSEKGNGYDEPFFIVQNSLTGEHVIGHLGWNSNWEMATECGVADPDVHPWGDELAASQWLDISIGPRAKDALRVLAPNESAVSPAVHLGVVSGDFDTAVQSMHTHIRKSVRPAHPDGRAHLIQYLAPGDQGYMDEHGAMDKGAIFDNIDLAAAVGCELFILDCGWFAARGHYEPHAERFPEGLGPVISYCREKGMLFGIWTEPERAEPNTPLYQQHPEWFMEHHNINMTQPDAARYVEQELHRQIERFDLDLIRVAYDTYFTREGGVTERHGVRENNYWRQTEVAHGIYRRVREKYPHLTLQNCADGIGRGGLGMAGVFHEGYMTDGLWTPQVLQIFSGRTVGFPPESYLIAHNAVREQLFGRPSDFDTYLRCQFTLGIPQLLSGMVGPGVDDVSPDRIRSFRRYADIYKNNIRPILPVAKVYHHEPVNYRGGVESSPWFAMQFMAPDRSLGWATIVRTGNEGDPTYLFKPKGLNLGKNYRVTYDTTGDTVEIPGWMLARDGLALRLEARTSSELLLLSVVP
jgi:alpha-galactosidase